MIILFNKNFVKKQKKLSAKVVARLLGRLELFESDFQNPTLNNHSLQGKLNGYWSINITGDLRAVYYFKTTESIVFTDIDTHSNLY
ncbi:MAG TPA: type II toxin-antitoxin system mRNA interferase toxin, RelE/StbE family [Candidatus Paceibacterota bacterium]